MGSQSRDRRFDVDGIDVRSTLRFMSLLTGDPSCRLGSRSFVRATLTPAGPATAALEWDDRSCNATAWGPGSSWLIDQVDGWAGCRDRTEGFDPTHRIVRAVWANNRQLRIQQTNTIWHDLMWFVLQQRVRFIDAARSWRALLERFGEMAPGPHDLLCPPTPERLAHTSYHDLHGCGIERTRAETLIGAAREMPRVDYEAPFAVTRRRLDRLRGIGPWTLAGLDSMTAGDADAVIVGDVGLPKLVCWFLAREEWGDDERMIDLLEPFEPHRYRIVQLAFASGVRVPQRRPSRYGTNDFRRV